MLQAASPPPTPQCPGWLPQNNFGALLNGHKNALKATRNFWRQLVRKDVGFADLTRAFAAMDAAEKRADSTFKMVGGRAGGRACVGGGRRG